MGVFRDLSKELSWKERPEHWERFSYTQNRVRIDRLQKLKDQRGWSLATERRVNQDDAGGVVRSQIMGGCEFQGKSLKMLSEGISRQWAVRWHDMTLATKYRMEAGRVSIWQLSRKEVMVIGTPWGSGRRDGKKLVHFGSDTLLSLYNIAVECGGKHLITDDSLLYGLDNHVSNEAVYWKVDNGGWVGQET